MELKTTFSISKKMTHSFDESREVKNIEALLAEIPAHLKQYVVEQNTTQYSPIDQAVWRYSLRQLKHFLSTHAHQCYLDGLIKTGIMVEEIPSIDQICEKLQKFGWSAVPVSGFIPPSAFMELQSLAILPIATEMRSIDHVLYTPAPDIVHEAAGHAPILVDPSFASYLKEYAAVAKKALISKDDLAHYEAIRELSDIKENPNSTIEEIENATEKLAQTTANLKSTSEAALLGRMNWWTAEYGLFGDIESPKIYGAGLLSSLGEAKNCLKDRVKKIPLTVDCINYSYDITEQQPQLFVAKNFERLSEVLEDLASTMAYRKGGVYGLEKAIECETVNTVELNSGLQASGKLVDTLKDKDNESFYFRFEGPCQLSLGGRELEGHNKSYHSHGFSSPLGRIKGYDECLSWASDEDLALLNIEVNKPTRIEYESGIIVEGKVKSIHRTPRRELCLISIEDCSVNFNGRKLFEPSWGTFDMAIGSKVVSVFSGPADRKAYGLTDSFAKKQIHKRQMNESETDLNNIYQKIRDWRKNSSFEKNDIERIIQRINKNFGDEWLLQLELIELITTKEDFFDIEKQLRRSLLTLIKKDQSKAQVINDGLAIAHQKI